MKQDDAESTVAEKENLEKTVQKEKVEEKKMKTEDSDQSKEEDLDDESQLYGNDWPHDKVNIIFTEISKVAYILQVFYFKEK